MAAKALGSRVRGQLRYKGVGRGSVDFVGIGGESEKMNPPPQLSPSVQVTGERAHGRNDARVVIVECDGLAVMTLE